MSEREKAIQMQYVRIVAIVGKNKGGPIHAK